MHGQLPRHGHSGHGHPLLLSPIIQHSHSVPSQQPKPTCLHHHDEVFFGLFFLEIIKRSINNIKILEIKIQYMFIL